MQIFLDFKNQSNIEYEKLKLECLDFSYAAEILVHTEGTVTLKSSSVSMPTSS